MPDAGLARGRMLRRTLGIVCLSIAAAGAGYLLLRRAQPVAPPRGVQAAEAAEATVPAPPPEARVQAPPALPVVLVPTPPRARRAAAALRAGEAAASSAEAASPGPEVSAGVHVAHPRAPKTYAGSVVLPGGAKIELGGIVWSETDPRALLNDRVVGVGGYVEGYSVSKIDTDRVELVKDGATLTITVK